MAGNKSRGGRASRRKGHDWEREVAARFRDVLGPDVRRGWQATGGRAPDVIAAPFRVECKKGRQTNLKRALDQAVASSQAYGEYPVAVCRDDRDPPTVTMLLDDFLALVREWWEATHGKETTEGPATD